jgi:hypothetical protein
MNIHLYWLKLDEGIENTSQMKEPLVSKLTIPHASPLYHTGNNILATTYSW